VDDAARHPSLAPPPVPATLRHWWLIGVPAVLLFAKSGAAIGALADPLGALARGESVVELILAGLALVAALALLLRRRIGWLLALSIVGWDLAAELALWWGGSPNYLSMALVAIVAALITSPDMTRLFAARSAP
jgi:uncharacterized membrane protein